MNRTGSSIVIVLCVMALLVLSITNVWRAAQHSIDLVFKRQQYMQRLYAAQGLMVLGIAQVREQFNKILEAGHTEFDYPSWQCGDNISDYAGVIHAHKQDKNNVHMAATLMRGGTQLLTLRADVAHSAEHYKVNTWAIEHG